MENTSQNSIPANDLELTVKLQKYFRNEENKDKDVGTELSNYENEYFYANKDNFIFKYTFKTNQTFKEVKQIIQEKTKFFPDMMSFGKFIRKEKRNKTDFFIYDYVNYKDDDVLYKSCYDSIYSEARIIYVIIDKEKNEKYKIYNNIYEEMDIKERKNNEKINNLEKHNAKINLEFENYRLESDRKEKNYQKQISKLNDKILESEESHKKEIDMDKNNLLIK